MPGKGESNGGSGGLNSTNFTYNGIDSVRIVQSTAAQSAIDIYSEDIICDSPRSKPRSVHEQNTVVSAYSQAMDPPPLIGHTSLPAMPLGGL